jgi:GNAT superfamily N-acetyltransferase
MSRPAIRPVLEGDRAQWLALWEAYSEGTASPDVTQTTWQRFLDPAEPVHALVAESEGRLVGFAHFILHRHTSSVEPVCFLQDLFTSPTLRRRGIARHMIEAVYAAARQEGSRLVYWRTLESNEGAIKLYDQLADRSGHIQYLKRLPPPDTSQ